MSRLETLPLDPADYLDAEEGIAELTLVKN